MAVGKNDKDARDGRTPSPSVEVDDQLFGVTLQNLAISLRVPELAERLGISTSRIYKLVERGEIPHYRIGSSLRFDPIEVRKWLQRFHHPATDIGCTGTKADALNEEAS